MRSVTARFFSLLKRNRKILFSTVFSLLLLWVFATSAFPSFIQAQTTTTAATSGWVQDPEVTLVGKAAERARQLLWWTIRNPGVYSAPVLAEYWSISRNIVYVFTLIVIVMFGFSFILLRRRASTSTIMPIIFKIAFVLLFATFSYIVLLGLIQFSEITMRFFIEQVGGKDLFNVIFSGAGSTTSDPFESNYYNFVGYREISSNNQEMVQTSLFLIRFTTFTYYIMSIMLILRTIILWFLLVLSPFLVILLPFVFIRNTGFIWIGVFFQWLFYGPLVAVFLGAITKIWVKGIPFPFDFSRAGKINGQVYKTSINILYGGPAQQLGPANSSNYIDTFAEYVISLIMLWTAIILPWLLLRIFRDYCCVAVAAGNATLTAIYDRLRQYPSPGASPTAPASPAATAVDLPFRQIINQNMKVTTPTRVEMIKEIEKSNTDELTKTLNLSVSRLSDVSRIETNQYAQSQIKQQLANLRTPESVASSSEKERFSILRQELQSRASAGDRQARILLNASGHQNGNLAAAVDVVIENRNEKAGMMHREMAQEKTAGSVPNTVSNMVRLNPTIARDIAQTTQLPESTVNVILKSIPLGGGGLSVRNVATLSKEQNISEALVNQIVSQAQSKTDMIFTSPSVSQIAQKVQLSEVTVSTILASLPATQVIDKGLVSQVALKLGISPEKVEEVYQAAQPPEPLPVSISSSSLIHMVDAPAISAKLNIDQKTVENILQKLPIIEIISQEIIRSISESTGVSTNVVEEIYKTAVRTEHVPSLTDIAQKAQTSESIVTAVLPLFPKKQGLKETVFEQTAKEANTTKEKVKLVYDKTQTSIYEIAPQIAPPIAQKLNLNENKVVKVLQTLPMWGTPSYETIQKAAGYSNLTTEEVKDISKVAIVSMLGSAKQSIEEIVETSGESETVVKTVLESLPRFGYPTPSRMAEAAKKAGISEARVKAIVTASHTASTKTSASGIAPTISLEDYEEVKRMWLNHYRSAPVPVNETIKDRNGWLTHEQKKLETVSELISSQDPKVKEKGLERVSEILPFLLLGGFSDIEILTYLKAKQEAVKQVTDELGVASVTREETVKKIISEDESTMVGVADKKEAPVAVSDTLSASFSDEDVSTVSHAAEPFQSPVQVPIPTNSTKTSWVQKITTTPTSDIASNLHLFVHRLVDVARPEINKETHANTVKSLNSISSPDKITDASLRSDFQSIHKTLEERATGGDVVAQRILTASNNPPDGVTPAASFILMNNRKSLGVAPGERVSKFSIYERALKDPSVTPYLAVKCTIPEPLVHQVIEFVADGGEVNDVKLNNISQRVHLPIETVKEIVTGAKELVQVNTLSVSDIATRVSLPSGTVKSVLEKIPTDHAMTPSEQEDLSRKLNISILQMMSIDEFTRQPIERYASSFIPYIAEKYSVPDGNVRALFHAVPAYTILTPEKIEDLGTQLDIKPDVVKQILQTVDESYVIRNDPFVTDIAKNTGETASTVQTVIRSLPTVGTLSESKRNQIAKNAQISLERVQKIEKGVQAQKKNSELLPSSVTVDDYEEVKNMWLNHYKNSPVPLSDHVKDRHGWISEETKKLESVTELLSSSDPKEKQKGLEKISEILPYMLLGGFSDVEMLTYLKAKYQAARETKLSLEESSSSDVNVPVSENPKKEIETTQNAVNTQKKEMPLPPSAKEKPGKAEKSENTLGVHSPTDIVDVGPVSSDKKGADIKSKKP